MWEGKWEIDSLAWPVALAFIDDAKTHDRTIFTPVFHRALQTIVSTLQCEQHHATCSHYSWPQPVPTHENYNPNTGMIWSAFRPSDDPVTYRFNVPQNAFAVVAMRLLARFAREAFGDSKLATDATALANQVQNGIERYGLYLDAAHGWMYVYETDGYGNDNLMDDANIPNLTALPYIGWCATDYPGLPRHAPIHVEFGRSVLLLWKVRDRIRESAHSARTVLAPRHHRRRHFDPQPGRYRPRHRHARSKRHAQRLDARMVRSQRSVALHAPRVRMGERILGRLALSHGGRLPRDSVRTNRDDRSARADERNPRRSPRCRPNFSIPRNSIRRWGICSRPARTVSEATHLLLAGALLLANAQRAHIDAVVREVMRERHVAGLSLGIARDGRRLYLRGYGLRDPNERLAADGYTMYSAGSIAKQFTAALVLQQVAAGRIALTLPPADISQCRPGPRAASASRSCSARPAGSSERATARPSRSTRAPHGSTTTSTTIFSAGSANRDRCRYPVLLRDRIAGPLSLSSTGCGPSRFAENVARGYAWRAGWSEQPAPVASAPGCAAAGLVSNAADLLRWLEALRTGGVVSTALMTAMTTSGKLANGIPTDDGFGFFITDWFGYLVAEHPGYVAGFSSDDALVLQDGLEIAVLTNADAVDVTPLTQSIVAILDAPLDANLSYWRLGRHRTKTRA